MHGDFGYMEEGKLGKPYDLRLLKRLGIYAVPYWKIIVLSLVVAVAITLMDLVLPYLSKVAIDRFILSSWQEIRLDNPEKKAVEDFASKYKNILTYSRDRQTAFFHNSNVKKIDPIALNNCRKEGSISEKSWYLIKRDNYALLKNKISRQKDIVVLSDGRIALPKSIIDGLPPDEILKIRASDIDGLVKVGIILVSILFLSFGMNYADYYLLEYIGQNIMQDVRVTLYEKIQRRALSFFNRNPVGRLVTRVTNDIENLNEMFKSVLVTLFKDVFMLAGILVMLLYLNWRLALVSFTILPVIFIFTLIFSRLMREAFRSLREKVSKLNSFQQEQFAGMRIIQLLTREKYQMRVFSGLNHENYLAGMHQLNLFAIFVPVMELLSATGIAIIIWYGGGKVISEQLSLGSLVAFISYIQMFFRPIRDISEKYNIMQNAMASTERIFEFMD